MTAPRQAALALAIGICTAALAARADDGADVHAFRSVSGTVRAVSAEDRKVTIDGPEGAVTLDFDRNTSVWLETRLGTVRDLVVGAQVRAQYGRDRRAAWIEVRRAAAPPASASPRDATPAGAAKGG